MVFFRHASCIKLAGNTQTKSITSTFTKINKIIPIKIQHRVSIVCMIPAFELCNCSRQFFFPISENISKDIKAIPRKAIKANRNVYAMDSGMGLLCI